MNIKKFICNHFTGHLYKNSSSLNHNQTGIYLINHCILCKEYEIKITSLKETYDSLYGYEENARLEHMRRENKKEYNTKIELFLKKIKDDEYVSKWEIKNAIL